MVRGVHEVLLSHRRGNPLLFALKKETQGHLCVTCEQKCLQHSDRTEKGQEDGRFNRDVFKCLFLKDLISAPGVSNC